MRFVVVIPARYRSVRLPGKPLVDLMGKSLVLRTYLQCAKVVPQEFIYVATDDERIADHCRAHGMQYIMTSPDCPTGTDRVAEVATRIPADLYVNVQGDEPLFNPGDIEVILDAARRAPGSVLNGFAPFTDEALFRNPTIPKVVMRPDGRLLYMSRGAIPTTKRLSFEGARRQICIYAFPPETLRAFAAAGGKTPLESLEDIEILRFLELGFEVQMVPLSDHSIAVDTPEDVERVLAVLRASASTD
ncbi:3-deoxy-manno-octulosonate cytidylyltransferase [Roseococcus microcysteis]|uniref:3-deoxy-manno-octulosonate cytidylyltransferase n=1 Tax=Roseococcus microcysteis TaxID=2771361 RepID=UPI00168A863C|nr:3-deoxy-manno-octulosonate cytidylyltransferase [Roseococcus microcysteis]